MSTPSGESGFAQLGLPQTLLQALADVGYETPSPIQAQIIPHVLAGHDVLGQAQTGTGKTAAFALPILARLDLSAKWPQALVLAPTRELAIQVAEALQKYAAHLPGFQVAPIYGGADYRTQLRQLQRGVQIVVGTPGRVMDHMRRGSLDLSRLQALVLDEADEMLRMGFIEDVEWILEQTPAERQVALFSATMPATIRRIAQRHLRDAKEVSIEVETVTNEDIRQRVWMMSGTHKLDALTRILEVEDFDAVIVFVRTRILTVELAEKLSARGFNAAALNGDIPQQQREQTVNRLKHGQLDIIVATDVAARGLDVARISHVVNYDIPSDVESYVHRIGRTGRAGRKGEAILFAKNRERRLLRAIERATGNTIERLQLPSDKQIRDKRASRFKARITDTLEGVDLDLYREWVTDYQQEHQVEPLEIAAALAAMLESAGSPAVSTSVETESRPSVPRRSDRHRQDSSVKRHRRETRDERDATRRDATKGRSEKAAVQRGETKSSTEVPLAMERFRIEVGSVHDVMPANIVGAIANEAGIESQYIGRIDIRDTHTFVELPEGMPKEIFKHLKGVWVSGQKLQISRLKDGASDSSGKVRARHGSEAKPGSRSRARKRR